MLLRSLVGNYVRQAASQHLREIVDHKVKHAEAVQQQRAIEPVAAAVVFATASESGGLVDLLGDVLTTSYETFFERSGHFKGRTIVIAESGVGLENSRSATQDLIAFHRPKLVFAAGFSASLDEGLSKGDILMAEKVSDESGAELTFQFNMDREMVEKKPNWHFGHSISVNDEITDFEQRRELAKSSGAVACDMETFAIAQVCAAEKVPCLPIRVIADGLEDDSRKLADAISNQESLAAKLGAAAGALWQKPKLATEMFALKQSAIERSDELARFLSGLLTQLPRPSVPDQQDKMKKMRLLPEPPVDDLS